MGQGHDPGVLLEQVAREVADIGVELARVQGSHRGGVVDDAVAGEVEQDRALLHDPQALGIDHVAGLVREGDVEGDEVRTREQIVHAHRRLHVRRQLPGALDRDGRVIADHLHPQGAGGIGHQDPDGPQPDDAQGTPGQLEADEGLLAGLHRLVDLAVRPGQPAGEAPGLGDVARRQQHPGQDQLLDRIGVGPGGVEDRHAQLGHARDRDIVDPGPGAAYGPNRLRQRHIVHIRRAHQDGVRVGDLRGDLIAVPWQPVQTGDGDVVQGEDLVHGRPLARWCMYLTYPAVQERAVNKWDRINRISQD